jgi:hypothetical protein
LEAVRKLDKRLLESLLRPKEKPFALTDLFSWIHGTGPNNAENLLFKSEWNIFLKKLKRRAKSEVS